MKKTRRNWLWFLHWRRQGPIYSYLEINEVSNTLTASVGSTGHSATLTVTNLDGSAATGVSVSYSSDTPEVCTVDASSGVLTLVSAGSATITGHAARGDFTHATNGTVTVTDPNTGDFTVSLNLA